MNLIICPHSQGPNSVGAQAARLVQNRLRQHERGELRDRPTAQPLVLALPTGSTPLGLYAALVGLYERGEMSFQRVVTLNLDEYVGLPMGHPQRFLTYMQRVLFERVDLPLGQAHVPDGMAQDLQAECDRYEALIASLGGIDLLIGGVGENGHVAFNEPGSLVDGRTHLVELDATTRQVNARFFDGELAQVPEKAITMGLRTILAAREVMILATGAKKARALRQVLQGPVSPAWPVSLLRSHPKLTVVCDLAACSV